MLSVVFLTYRPGTIDIMADSLANQTFKNFEVIVVDDHPVDRRAKVRAYLEGRGLRVAYVGPSKPKCFPDVAFNVSTAINTGFIMSRGEYVMLYQDFIWLHPDHLEKIMSHEEEMKKGACIVLGAQLWECPRKRNDQGVITLWNPPWQGPPESNGCFRGGGWMPEAWEFAVICFPWHVAAGGNGWPEWQDAYAAHQLGPIISRFEKVGGHPLVLRDSPMDMLNHREWQPAELWHQAKRAGSSPPLERENTFNLLTIERGVAFWQK